MNFYRKLAREQKKYQEALNHALGPLSEKNKKPAKRKKFDQNVKHAVWHRYNPKKTSGECYACDRVITFEHFEIGHNKAHSRGGKDVIWNLRPICTSCNKCMGTMTIEVYRRKYFGKEKKPVQKKMPPKQKKSNKLFFGTLDVSRHNDSPGLINLSKPPKWL